MDILRNIALFSLMFILLFAVAMGTYIGIMLMFTFDIFKFFEGIAYIIYSVGLAVALKKLGERHIVIKGVER